MSDDDVLIGTIIGGRYKLVRRLGEGSMGAVYLGEHLKIGRLDAIKVLRGPVASDPETLARFTRGARIVSSITHPNVCTIYDYNDTAEGVPFLAMEYIVGDTLKDVLEREHSLTPERAVQIASDIGSALEAAHQAGIVHRDLKPGNIMISPRRGGGDAVKVVDFDIAKSTGIPEQTEVTRLGFVVGTPEYMSPEQLTGDVLDGRSDVYSLAVVLFRMLTGMLPSRSTGVQDLMVERLTQSPPTLAEASPYRTFPPGLQRALDRALSRRPSERPGADQFSKDIALALTGDPLAEEPSASLSTQTPAVTSSIEATAPGAQLPKTRVLASQGSGEQAQSESALRLFVRRNRVALVAAVLVVFATGGILSFYANRNVTATTTPPDARPPATQGETPNVQPAPNPNLATTDPSRAIPGERSNATADPSALPPVSPEIPLANTARAIAPENAYAIVWRQFERLGPPEPAEEALQSIRDTARAVLRQPGITARDSALAAYVLGSAWKGLGYPARCVELLSLAIKIEPDNDSYRRQRDACAGEAQ